jgi:hypothetical protein
VAATIAIVGGIALARLDLQHEWVANYLTRLRSAFGPAGSGIGSLSNPNRVELINLDYLLRLFLTSPSLAQGLASAVALALAFPGLRTLTRRPTGVILLECVALLAAVELLVFYHRAYDAVVLAFPMAWALSPSISLSRSWPVLMTVGCYLFPGGVAVRLLGESRFVPSVVSASAVWQTIVIPYQAWAVLIMAIWMSYCVLRPGNVVGAAVPSEESTSVCDCRVQQ